MSKKTSTASTLGSILAILQSLFDDFVSFIFRQLKTAGSAKSKKPENRLIRLLKDIARFFGELGDSFYKTYERIKKDKST